MDTASSPSSSPAPKPSSPPSTWRMVAIGCGGLLALGLLAGIVILWQGLSAIGSQISDMSDPQKQGAQLEKVFGTHQLPPGYYATIALQIESPLRLKVAMLTDRAPSKTEGQNERQLRGLSWFEVHGSDSDNRSIRDFIDGKEVKVDLLNRWGLAQEISHPLQRGSIEQEGMTVHYTTFEGTVKVQNEEDTGINTVFSVACPQDPSDLVRFGLWFSRHPDDLAALKSLPSPATAASAEPTGAVATQTGADIKAEVGIKAEPAADPEPAGAKAGTEADAGEPGAQATKDASRPSGQTPAAAGEHSPDQGSDSASAPSIAQSAVDSTGTHGLNPAKVEDLKALFSYFKICSVNESPAVQP